jgi:toxin ParE1/3/4
VTLRIQKSNRAKKDINRIAEYLVEEAGLNTGERFSQAVERAFSEMAEMPGMGWNWRSLNTRLKGIRVWSVPGFNDYLIFYRENKNELEIFRIHHGARDLVSRDVNEI